MAKMLKYHIVMTLMRGLSVQKMSVWQQLAWKTYKFMTEKDIHMQKSQQDNGLKKLKVYQSKK